MKPDNCMQTNDCRHIKKRQFKKEKMIAMEHIVMITIKQAQLAGAVEYTDCISAEG